MRVGGEQSGHVAVFGDSSCLDDAHRRNRCFWLLDAVLGVVCDGVAMRQVFSSAVELSHPLLDTRRVPPTRLVNSTLPQLSHVVNRALVCNAALNEMTLVDAPVDVPAIEWPRVLWASDTRSPADVTPNTAAHDGDASSVRGARLQLLHFWRSALDNVDARTVILPYLLGVLAAIAVGCVAARVPNRRKEL